MELQPMSVGDILDKSFFLYRDNFKLFISISFVTFLAIMVVVFLGAIFFGIVIAIGALVIGEEVLKSLLFMIPGGMIAVLAILLLTIGGFIIYFIGYAAIVKALSEIYMGRDLNFQDAYRAVIPYMLKYFWVISLASVIISLWIIALALIVIAAFALKFYFLLLLTLPFIYMLYKYCFGYSFTAQTVFLEYRTGMDALNRSMSLFCRSWWKVVLVTIIMGLIVRVIGTIFSCLPVPYLNFFLLLFSNIVLMPLPPLAATLVYYDIRIRTEGLDMSIFLDSLGGSDDRIEHN